MRCWGNVPRHPLAATLEEPDPHPGSPLGGQARGAHRPPVARSDDEDVEVGSPGARVSGRAQQDVIRRELAAAGLRHLRPIRIRDVCDAAPRGCPGRGAVLHPNRSTLAPGARVRPADRHPVASVAPAAVTPSFRRSRRLTSAVLPIAPPFSASPSAPTRAECVHGTASAALTRPVIVVSDSRDNLPSTRPRRSKEENPAVKVATAVAEILKREGVEFLIGYPVNPIIEAAAEADIRTIIVRQERTGLHMADAVSRVTSGRAGSACSRCSTGPAPRTRSAASPRRTATRCRSSCCPAAIRAHPERPAELQRAPQLPARHQVVRAGRSCPTSVPRRHAPRVHPGEERPPAPGAGRDPRRRAARGGARPLDYTPAPRLRMAPDPQAVTELAAALVAAERPVIYAGQGVHYAQAWQQLRELAELLEAPVTTSLQGKSAFPENHPLSLGSGGRSITQAGPPLPDQRRPHLRHRLQLRDDELRRGDARRASASSTPRSTRRPQQGHRGRRWPARRRRAHAGRADRRGPGPAARASRAGAWRGVTQEIDGLKSEWLAPVDAEAHRRTPRRSRPTG